MKTKRICKAKDCDKEIEIRNKTGFCRPCCNKNRTLPQKYCKLCSTKIDNRSKNGLCHPCLIGQNHPNYKPEIHKQYYCIGLDCNNKIHYDTWKNGSKRCQSCAGKEFYKSPEAIRKMSLAHGGTGIPYENTGYPPEFDEMLKNCIRMRDGYICQGEKCGMTEKEHKIKFNRVLSVHHIDSNKQNSNKDNLIALCARCNTKANYSKKYWEEYFKEKVRNKNEKEYYYHDNNVKHIN